MVDLRETEEAVPVPPPEPRLRLVPLPLIVLDLVTPLGLTGLAKSKDKYFNKLSI